MNTETLKLDNEVVNNWVTNYIPHNDTQVIITILNGAKHVGNLLSNKYNIPQKFIHLKSYNNDNNQESIKLINKFPNISEKRLLVVDDIYDTGNTLQYTLNELIKYTTVEHIDIYTVIKKPRPGKLLNTYTPQRHGNPVKCSIGYSCTVPETTWIKFPWE